MGKCCRCVTKTTFQSLVAALTDRLRRAVDPERFVFQHRLVGRVRRSANVQSARSDLFLLIVSHPCFQNGGTRRERIEGVNGANARPL